MAPPKRKSYNDLLLEKYKDFLGKAKLETLLGRLSSSEQLAGKWEQVITSRTTSLFGTGPTSTSVRATYTSNEDGSIGVLNEAYDANFKKVSIKGISKAFDDNVPTFRTVEFGKNDQKGNYWICYATRSGRTFIVAAPLVVKFQGKPFVVTNTLAHYVLTKDREGFWNSDEERQATLKALKGFGFNNYFNKPVATGLSLKHDVGGPP
jgi:lipocalin